MKKERTQITQELCDHVKILLAGGANIDKAAEITKTGHATISRIKAAGFDAEVYRKNQQQRKAKKKPEMMPEGTYEWKTGDEFPGQLRMDLQAAEEPKAEMSDQIKLMRFQAAQADKICEKLFTVNGEPTESAIMYAVNLIAQRTSARNAVDMITKIVEAF